MENKEYYSWDEYWNALEKVAVRRFKESEDYNVLNGAVDNSIEIIDDIQNEDVSDIIQNSEIDSTNAYDMLSYEHQEG